MRRIILASFLLSVLLSGCEALLVLPTVVAVQEASRDRKGDFEREMNAQVGMNFETACQVELKHIKYSNNWCGRFVRIEKTDTDLKVVLDNGLKCAFSYTIGPLDNIIKSWAYVGVPTSCWEFRLRPLQ
jgi:hypothetical protein